MRRGRHPWHNRATLFSECTARQDERHSLSPARSLCQQPTQRLLARGSRPIAVGMVRGWKRQTPGQNDAAAFYRALMPTRRHCSARMVPVQ